MTGGSLLHTPTIPPCFTHTIDMSEIANTIRLLHASVPQHVKIVAVSKFHPVEELREAYDAGQRIFGESRQQELLQKIPQMPQDVAWHFIGHLQTNKVRSIVGKVAMIESVDTERLLGIIDAESAKAGVRSAVLLQLHVAREETKFGFTPEELLEFFASGRYRSLQATDLRGVMGMASNTDDTARIRADFDAIASTFRTIRAEYPDLEHFDTVSMGMTHDYRIAIEAGSNMVRIGTAIFGERQYNTNLNTQH